MVKKNYLCSQGRRCQCITCHFLIRLLSFDLELELDLRNWSGILTQKLFQIMCSKFLSTLATRTSCPHANWPCFVLDGGKSHFNCPLICCRTLLHQQLLWHRIKHTRKHYFSTQIINSAKSHKILFWKKKENLFFSSSPFFSVSHKATCNELHLSGSFEIPPTHIHTHTLSL